MQKTCVIVEDELDTSEMFAEMMRLSGYLVRKSYSAKSALALIAQEKPSVILLDIMMPDVSGLEVLRFVRRDPSLAHIPVVVISAKSLPADVKTGIDAGASIYLTKPVSFLDLKKAVENAIQQFGQGVA